MSTPEAGKPVYNVKNPCIAKVKRLFDLSGPGAPKHTAHYEIDLAGESEADMLIERISTLEGVLSVEVKRILK